MILIIDNYDSFTYNLYQAIAPLYSVVKVIRNDALTIDEIKALQPSGMILSPGPSHPNNAGVCIEVVRQMQSTPILGVCLGHQAIAVAFGGKVIQAESVVHGRADDIYHQQNGYYRVLPLPFSAARYHSLIVEKESLPADLIIEAENSEGIIMGIRHKDKPIVGIQFHPESILTPLGDLFLKEFVSHCQQVNTNAA